MKFAFRKLVHSISIAVLSCGLATGCYMSTSDNNDASRAKLTAKIGYAYLASEGTRPYVNKRDKDYNSFAVEKYPTVQSCLIPSEQTVSTPDLRLIDWDRVRTRAELEVCLWRIFSSLKYPEPVLEWLDFHRAVHSFQNRGVFDVYPRRKFTNLKFDFTMDYKERHGSGNDYVVSFGWYKKIPFKDQQALSLPSFFSIGVTFDGSDQTFSRVSTQWLRSF